MSDTKEQILQSALRLFAKDGYEAVSVSAIAGELGMTKGALYRHYESKRAIFDCILSRMEEKNAENTGKLAVPTISARANPVTFRRVSVDAIIDYAKAQFHYWTEDAFASDFRKMLTLEQHRNEEMSELYQRYLVSGPLMAINKLISDLGIARPTKEAMSLYAPMFLLYSVYDGTEDKSVVLSLLDYIMESARNDLKSR